MKLDQQKPMKRPDASFDDRLADRILSLCYYSLWAFGAGSIIAMVVAALGA
jgi:hypothetical protein